MMKNELQTNYVSPSLSARHTDKWHQYTQGNKSAKEYLTKFDEFLIKCSTLNTEGKAQTLSSFRIGFRENL